MPIRDLRTHPARFVTIADLAEYWGINRQQIYKRIDAGELDAIQLGSRLYRVRTAAALDYERKARVSAAGRVGDTPPSLIDKLPRTIGPRRVFKKSDV